MTGEWVLAERDLKRPENVTYFRQWTGIGPMGTANLDEAQRFDSERAAMQSPAFTFWLTFYRPEQLVPAEASA